MYPLSGAQQPSPEELLAMVENNLRATAVQSAALLFFGKGDVGSTLAAADEILAYMMVGHRAAHEKLAAKAEVTPLRPVS